MSLFRCPECGMTVEVDASGKKTVKLGNDLVTFPTHPNCVLMFNPKSEHFKTKAIKVEG